MLTIQPAFQAFLLLLLSAGHAKATPTSSGIRLSLVERDNLSFSPDNDYPRRMERDARRVSSLIRRLSAGSKVEEYKTDVSYIGGTYAVTIGVGTPPQNQTLLMDTGSDLLWVQCQSCDQCYDQNVLVFYPNRSTSFSTVPCESNNGLLTCQRLDEQHHPGCDFDNRCTYNYSYADGSHTQGILATETLTFGATTVPGMPIGCGRKNKKFNMGEGGILGLGGGPLSFVGGKRGLSFSYCLGRPLHADGWLEIGPSNFSENATWIPMIRNPNNPSFYYVELLDIVVGGEKVKIPEGTFRINKDNEGGVIMDTGTEATYLPKAAYEPFRDMFVAKSANITWAPKSSGLETCYYYSADARVPDVSFSFSRGLTLNLNQTNTQVWLADGVICFAFAPLSTTNFAILGSTLQQGIRISIDGTEGNIGFGPDGC